MKTKFLGVILLIVSIISWIMIRKGKAKFPENDSDHSRYDRLPTRNLYVDMPSRSDSFKVEARLVDQIYSDWLQANLDSSAEIEEMVNLTVQKLSISDELVELLQKLTDGGLHLARSAMDLEIKRLLAHYDEDLLHKLTKLSGSDTKSEYDSLWFKSYACASIARICDEFQFKSLVDSLQGVPKRKAIEGYALKLAETEPVKSLELILGNLPEEGEWYITVEGQLLDLDFSTLPRILDRMSLEETQVFFEKISQDTLEGSRGKPDLYRFYKSGFDKILDIVGASELPKAIELIQTHSFAYDEQSYSRLLQGREKHPDQVMQLIPKGAAYDVALSNIVVPPVPKNESNNGGFSPSKADYDQYLDLLNRIEMCAYATQTAPCRQRILDEISAARQAVAALPN